jgi:uncharacterized protein (DUF433 family)
MSDWIIARPDLLGGKPCIKGSRISVEHILELLASGATTGEILDAYPHLTRESLLAALQYAARTMKNEVVWETTIPA